MTNHETQHHLAFQATADTAILGPPCPPILAYFNPQNRIEISARTTSSSDDREQNVLFVAELTRRCNLRCVHCYADAGPEVADHGFMTFDRWKSVFEWGRQQGYGNLQLIGGEVTLHPDFPELLEFGKKLGFDVEVFSNGVSHNTKARSALANIRPKMAFSLYSADPETHDDVTKIQGSFQRTWNTIAWCMNQNWAVRVAVIAVYEDGDGFDRIRKQLYSMGVLDVTYHEVQPIGRALNLVAADSDRRALCGMCGKGMICVTASGDVYRCVFSRTVPLGRVGAGIYTDMLDYL